MRELLRLLPFVPLFPFLGALVNGVTLRNALGRRGVAWVACGASGLTALLALGAIAGYMGSGQYATGRPFEIEYATWIAPVGMVDTVFQGTQPFRAAFGLLLDPLACVMLFVVTFVGFLIHLYSAGYMAHEEGFQRYFTYLNLFLGAMLLLVLGDNYLVMFAGWEGVGLCSYLLIGFYFKQDFPPFAGRKAFLVNRIGDLGFLIALFALISHFGTLRFREIFPLLKAYPHLGTGGGYLGLSLATFVGLFLFIGAMGKSAQLPLYVWLPDAMAGPTPVSALIHAATMVTAGVYMVARSNALYALAPGVSSGIAWTGALTALFAATIALAQDDLKKVLAYSTVSQLGYMFLAAGLGAYAASIFHLMTHAFFKALLFLGAGSVIHALSGEQDLRKMGGLAKHLPATTKTMLIGAAALAGVPPLAGFFSKDEILHAAAEHGKWALWGIGLLTAGLTAFYMTRAFLLAFTGEFRGSEEARHHLHESPRSMTIPLWILAGGAVLVGFLGLPAIFAGEQGNLFHRFLAPVVGDPAQTHVGAHGVRPPTPPPGTPAAVGTSTPLGEAPLMLIAVAVAALGIFLAWRLYGQGRGVRADDAFAARWPGLHRLLTNKYYVDEGYDAAIVRPTWGLARLLHRFDARAIDGFLVHGVRHLTVLSSLLSGFFDKYFVDGLVNLVGWLPRRASYRLRRLQNGLVSRQALALLAGLFLLVCAYLALDRGALSWWIGGGGG